jgi:hypothetical protein
MGHDQLYYLARVVVNGNPTFYPLEISREQSLETKRQLDILMRFVADNSAAGTLIDVEKQIYKLVPDDEK